VQLDAEVPPSPKLACWPTVGRGSSQRGTIFAAQAADVAIRALALAANVPRAVMLKNVSHASVTDCTEEPFMNMRFTALFAAVARLSLGRYHLRRYLRRWRLTTGSDLDNHRRFTFTTGRCAYARPNEVEQDEFILIDDDWAAPILYVFDRSGHIKPTR